MLNNKNFTILSPFCDSENWVEKMQFRFDGDTVEEDVGVLEADNLVMGTEEASFLPLNKVEIVITCRHVIRIEDRSIIKVENVRWSCI